MQRATTVPLGPGRAPSVAPGAFTAPGATLVGAVRVAEGASVWFGAVLRAEFATITVGEGANIQDNAVVHVDEGFPADIGRDVSVGHNAVVHGATVGEGSLVGMNATVLNGSVIGPGCLVAAGTVVLAGTVVPEGSLVAGVPGRVRRPLTDEERAGLRANAESYRSTAAIYHAPTGS
ncbi:gamma carbonic anhydrase family protein [Streptomyces sp. NPDC050560]|uniref:gamma carbonic anhydrase family protein n=1 Tax=Streptomyces sp. NPDC050560 TaxID=3365630 RepID=UPI0037A95BCB